MSGRGAGGAGPRSLFVDAGGRTLHASVHEPGRAAPAARPAAPTVLLLHSLGTDSRLWHGVAARLGARARCVALDLAGHGLSSPPEELPDGPCAGPADARAGGLHGYARDALATLDALGAERASIVGLSIGGLVAQRLALDAPGRVAALVLACTAARIGDPARYAARIDAVRAGGIEAIADAQLERWFSAGFAAREPAAVAGVRRMLVGQDVAGYLAGCAALAGADLTDELGGIGAPTLCLAGAEDRSTPPAALAALAERIPGAALETLRGAGHLPCLERPAAFAASATVLLDSAVPAGRCRS